MPGPVSDSYDPEWGTGANRDRIENELTAMYRELGRVIGGPPKYIMEVVDGTDGPLLDVQPGYTEKQWRLLRFALERAIESL